MRYIGEYEELTTEFHKRGKLFYGDFDYPARSVVPFNVEIIAVP
jgi:hypothetical protein